MSGFRVLGCRVWASFSTRFCTRFCKSSVKVEELLFGRHGLGLRGLRVGVYTQTLTLERTWCPLQPPLRVWLTLNHTRSSRPTGCCGPRSTPQPARLKVGEDPLLLEQNPRKRPAAFSKVEAPPVTFFGVLLGPGCCTLGGFPH